MATREEWIAARRTGITATEIAAVVGLDDAYGSKMDVYLDKIGEADEPAETPERMRWGLALQGAILDGYSEKTGEPLEAADPYLSIPVPGHPLLRATLDARWAKGDRRPVDAKNIGFQGRDWGEAETDDVPGRYWLQMQVQMAATETGIADLAVLFGGNRLLVYHVQRDEEIIRRCIAAAERFWSEHVAPRVPPPIDASPAWQRYLARQQQVSEAVIDSDLRLDRWAHALRIAELRRRQIEQFEEMARNVLRRAIGPNAGAKGPWGRASFRQSNPRVSVDWRWVAEALRDELRAGRVGAEGRPEADALFSEIVKEATSTTSGTRALRVTWAEDVPVLRFDERALAEAQADLPALPPAGMEA